MRVNSPVKLLGQSQPSNQGLHPWPPPTSQYARPTYTKFKAPLRTIILAFSPKTRSLLRSCQFDAFESPSVAHNVALTSPTREGISSVREVGSMVISTSLSDSGQPKAWLAFAFAAFAHPLDEPRFPAIVDINVQNERPCFDLHFR
ncbi:hypothetical protein PENSPDRAFT_760202 [Peniophora sp. CONT]|nr:hypothetical protein PENSPDRAFT_760202 [Peniophora sp. CONT]